MAMSGPDFSRSRDMQARMHRLIPGGCHTYSKGDDQYPEGMAPVIARGAGCRVWDVDANEYIEYGMGSRAVGLGHAYEPVLAAVREQLGRGENFVRPAAIELEAAERLLSLLPAAEMVKFAKNGSDVVSAAVKLARAYTHRELIAVCGDHPFFSVDDWYLAGTPLERGIPENNRALSLRFSYNDIDSVRTLLAAHPGQIAGFLMEPEKEEPLALDFVRELQELAHADGGLLILDEMITGFRWHTGGAQALYDLQPDLSTFGKAMGNGFSVAALAGRREIMELGGLQHDEERVFLLSSTHGAEAHCLAAFIAVAESYARQDVIAALRASGERLREGFTTLARQHGIEDYVSTHGHPAALVYATRDAEGKRSQSLRTLFMQECLRGGLLAPSLVVSFAHGDAEIDRTLTVIDRALKVYARALEDGVERHLEGRPVRPVFRRFNHRD